VLWNALSRSQSGRHVIDEVSRRGYDDCRRFELRSQAARTGPTCGRATPCPVMAHRLAPEAEADIWYYIAKESHSIEICGPRG
jgi:hypothetical protein